MMDRLGVEPGAVRMTATSAARGRVEPRRLLRPGRGGRRRAARAALRRRGGPRCPSPARPPGSRRDRAPFLVFDLGGGSTEFAYGTDEVEAAVSIDVGCVRLTERFIEHDPPQPEELVAAISYTESWLDDVDSGHPVGRRRGHGDRAGRHGVDRRGRRDRPRHLRPRPRPPLRAHPRRPPRTCSARSPPSPGPTASTTRASRRPGPT